jgi:hypothetical protein
VTRDLERAPEAVNLRDEAYVRKAAERMPDVVSAYPLAWEAAAYTPLPSASTRRRACSVLLVPAVC